MDFLTKYDELLKVFSIWNKVIGRIKKNLTAKPSIEKLSENQNKVLQW